jgi:hypothetical protein
MRITADGFDVLKPVADRCRFLRGADHVGVGVIAQRVGLHGVALHVDPRGFRVGEHLEKLERGDRGLAHCPCIFCSRKKRLFWMP